MRFDTEYNLIRGEEDIELFVTYTMSAYVPATYWEPAEGGDIEIESVTLSGSADNKQFTLTDEEAGKLADHLSENTEWPEYDDYE